MQGEARQAVATLWPTIGGIPDIYSATQGGATGATVMCRAAEVVGDKFAFHHPSA